MKKLLLITASIFVSVQLLAQSYIPIPDTNATWNIHEQGYIPCATSNFQWLNRDMTIFISGDTVFNGFTYKKLYATGIEYTSEIIGLFCNDNLSSSFNNQPYGAFRNDTAAKQVWFIRYGFCSTPGVMFDFSLNVGDSLTSVDGCGVSSVNGVVLADTSIVYGGLPRRVMLYGYNYSMSFWETSTIIEGIGSTLAGLFDAYHHFEYNSSLICFAHNDTTVYPNNTTSCDLITAVQEWAKTKAGISVFPNPCSGEIKISFPEPINSVLKLYNSFGTVVHTEVINQKSDVELNLQRYPSGIYFAQVSNNNKIYSQKIIIQNR